MLFSDPIKVQDLPYLSRKSCSFSEEKPEAQGLFKSYARDQAGGKRMGWILYSSPGSLFFI